jgi:hypothetical protein
LLARGSVPCRSAHAQRFGVCPAILFAAVLLGSVPSACAQASSPVTDLAQSSGGYVLEDGTPVRMRFGKTVSSADAEVGDRIEFEVLDEVRIGNVLAVQKGAIATGTVTEVEPKRKMARGGKLGITLDHVRLANGQKAPLRADKTVKGGGHKGAMTGAMIGSAVVFSPAAPFFLFVEGKDISLKKGRELLAYINGDVRLDFSVVSNSTSTKPVNSDGGLAELEVSSVLGGAEIRVDGKFVGQTPSSLRLRPGDHEVIVSKPGLERWRRTLAVLGGRVKIIAELKRVQ